MVSKADQLLADEKLLKALRSRDHAGVSNALEQGANPNTTAKTPFKPKGASAIHCVDPSDTQSFIMLAEAGADLETPVPGKKHTLVQQLVTDINNAPHLPQLQSRLQRLQLVLAAGGSVEPLFKQTYSPETDSWYDVTHKDLRPSIDAKFLLLDDKAVQATINDSKSEIAPDVFALAQRVDSALKTIHEQGDIYRPNATELGLDIKRRKAALAEIAAAPDSVVSGEKRTTGKTATMSAFKG